MPTLPQPIHSYPGKSWPFSCSMTFAYVAYKCWLFIKIPACLQGMRWKADLTEAFHFLQRCVCKTLVKSTMQMHRDSMQMSDTVKGRTSSSAGGKWVRSNSYPDFHQLWWQLGRLAILHGWLTSLPAVINTGAWCQQSQAELHQQMHLPPRLLHWCEWPHLRKASTWREAKWESGLYSCWELAKEGENIDLKRVFKIWTSGFIFDYVQTGSVNLHQENQEEEEPSL